MPASHLSSLAMTDSKTIRPLRFALTLGAGYILVSAVYIISSDLVANQLATSQQQLALIGKVKGIAFIIVTGILQAIFAYWLARRIKRAQAESHRQQAALVQSESRALAGIIGAAAMHDMRNILCIMQCYGEMVEPGLAKMGHAEDARILNDSVQQLTSLMNGYLDVNRATAGDDRRAFDLAETVRGLQAFAAHHPKLKSCRFSVSVDESLPFVGNERLINRMLLNLAVNAAEASEPSPIIEVHSRADEAGVVLEVHDNGPGISESQRREMFAPFFTTKSGGTGLGLLSVKVCAREHNGTVEVARSPLGGALFRIRLRADGKSTEGATPASASHALPAFPSPNPLDAGVSYRTS